MKYVILTLTNEGKIKIYVNMNADTSLLMETPRLNKGTSLYVKEIQRGDIIYGFSGGVVLDIISQKSDYFTISRTISL